MHRYGEGNILSSKNIMIVKPQKTNTIDINDPYIAMKPLLMVMNFFGISHNPYRAQWKKRLHSLLMLTLLWILAIPLVATRFLTAYVESFRIADAADLISLAIFLILATFNLISAFSSPTAIQKCEDNFQAIDSLLCIDKQILYKKGRITVCKLMVFYISTVTLIICIENLTMRISTVHVSLFIIDYILYYLNTFVIIYFFTIMYYLKTKFFILNVELQVWCQTGYKDHNITDEINIPREQKPYIFRSFFENYVYSCDEFEELGEKACLSKKLDINNLIDAYLYSCEQADIINSLFSIQNLLTIKYGIFSIIRCLNFAVSALSVEKHYAKFGSCSASLLFSTYDLMNIFLILLCCEFVKSEARKTTIYLDTVLNRHLGYTEERDKLEAWIQLTTRRFPQFTACGFFNLDLALFYNLLGTIFTYLIVLVQLK